MAVSMLPGEEQLRAAPPSWTSSARYPSLPKTSPLRDVALATLEKTLSKRGWTLQASKTVNLVSLRRPNAAKVMGQLSSIRSQIKGKVVRDARMLGPHLKFDDNQTGEVVRRFAAAKLTWRRAGCFWLSMAPQTANILTSVAFVPGENHAHGAERQAVRTHRPGPCKKCYGSRGCLAHMSGKRNTDSPRQSPRVGDTSIGRRAPSQTCPVLLKLAEISKTCSCASLVYIFGTAKTKRQCEIERCRDGWIGENSSGRTGSGMISKHWQTQTKT